MSVQNSLSKVAATDLAGRRVVYVDTNGEAAYCPEPLSGSVGVTMDNAATPAGDYVSIITSGITYCECSGSIVAGQWLTCTSDGDGKVTNAMIDTDAQFLIGQAVSDDSGGLVQINVAPSFAASGSFA